MRARFNSSGLVRSLGDLGDVDLPEPKQSFAERLGQWFDFNDALALFSALNADAGGVPEARAVAPYPEAAEMRQACERVRRALTESITTGRVLESGEAAGAAADFTPYRRYYLARQRDMSASIGGLRARVRTALSRKSAALKRLAILDAVLEQGLAARERELLATVPSFLAGRFAALSSSAQLAEDDPERGTQPDAGLARFCAEMQSVLRAELELRLQPVAGLIAALETR